MREPTHRLDVVPMLALNGVVTVGDVAVGPAHELLPAMFSKAGTRRAAWRFVRYHRLHNGKPINRPSVIAAASRDPLPATADALSAARIARSIEAFRYLALLQNRVGFGPYSTHLHVESYRFGDGPGTALTVGSRFSRVMGIQRHQQRAWVHISPSFIKVGSLDGDLAQQLSAAVTRRSKLATRLWRAIWWFNQAHHDDPYQPYEFSILCLASAFEALIRPSDKVRDLQKAISTAVAGTDLDQWVKDFYGARSAISHGDESWQPMFGPHRHIDHYRIASQLFPVLVEQRLVDMSLRPSSHPLLKSMVRLSLSNLLSSDEDLISRLLPHSMRSLRLRRNDQARLDLQFLSTRLNGHDLSTGPERYEALREWLRGIALSACRSGAARYPSDKAAFDRLRANFGAGIPDLSEAGLVPAAASQELAFRQVSERPENRPLIGDVTLDDLADAMRTVEDRRQMAMLRE